MADRKWAYLGLLIVGFVTWTISMVITLNRGGIFTIIVSGIFAIVCLYQGSRYRRWEETATKREIPPSVIFSAVLFGIAGLIMVGFLFA